MNPIIVERIKNNPMFSYNISNIYKDFLRIEIVYFNGILENYDNRYGIRYVKMYPCANCPHKFELF